MRFTHAALLGLLSVSMTAAVACGNTVSSGESSSAGGGSLPKQTTSAATTATGSVTVGSVASTGAGGTMGTSVATSVASTTTGPFMEAPFPTPPQVQNLGGSVLASPHLYAIFYGADDAGQVASLTDFMNTLGSSTYWKATTAEYGVGPATATIITLTEAPPASPIADASIQTWLEGKFGTDAQFPATPGQDDLYVIFYPAGVNAALQNGGQTVETCVNMGGGAIGGYHDETQALGVSYAVVPRCTFPGMSTLETATGSASHEIAEGVTDPHPHSAPAYLYTDNADIYWALALGGGEVGDMCAQAPSAFAQFPGLPYVVQRIWSNAQAAAGHDPCQPEPAGEVYYNAAPVLGMVTASIQGQQLDMRGVKIAVGQTATVPVKWYSDAPLAAWATTGVDLSSAFMGGPQLLSLTLTPPTGANGTMGTLTITVNQAGQDGNEYFLVGSSNDNNQTVNWSIGLVTN